MQRAWRHLALTASAGFAIWAGVHVAQAAAITITAPAENAELSGVVEVAATIVQQPGEAMEPPAVQTSAGDRAPLARTTGDTYAAKLDTTKLRNGRQQLLVLTSAKGVTARREKHDDNAWGSPARGFSAEVTVVVRNPYRFYRGNVHAHTSYSDGVLTPREAYAYARDRSKLDFFAVTDHSQILTAQEYADVMAQADQANASGRFAALYGVEETEQTGHLNCFMTPTPRLPAGLDGFYQALSTMHLLGHLNHPSKTKDNSWNDDFQGFHYAPAADREMAMVECRSPKEEECYVALLDAGWHVAPTADQDNHSADWGDGQSCTVALARSLSRESILDAMWSRRIYSAADRDLDLTFILDGEDMGAQITRPAGTLPCSVTVTDGHGDAITRMDLVVDGKQAASAAPGATQYAWSVPVQLTAGKHYVYVRVQQAPNRMSYSAPVWVSAY